MMPDIFKAGIANQVVQAMGSLLFPVILIKRSSSTRAELTGGVNTREEKYSGRGFIDDYKDSRIDGTIIKVGDRMVTILGASISSVPEPDDQIIIEGKTWTIVGPVRRDPAGAIYECQVR